MKKTDKANLIEDLSSKIAEYAHFYVADTSGLNAGATSELRRLCFQKDVIMMVVKNTLFLIAIEKCEKNIEGVVVALKGTSAVLFSNTGNVHTKLSNNFRKKAENPTVKSAFLEE